MITKKFLSDESGLTVALETILLFSISVIFFGMIYFSFQDMNQRQSKILVEEELLTIGNTIAKQLSDLTVEARASNTMGSHTTITSEIYIPEKISDISYKVTLTAGKILLESTSLPYISVEVPVNEDINLAENSTIYSNDEKYLIEYDSQSSAIYFTNGGVVPFPDFNAPTISIDSPPDNAEISGNTYINTTPWDESGYVARVEFYVNEAYRYTAGSPYQWLWDTLGEMDGNYTVTAVAYDAAGHTTPASRNYTIYNPFSFAPVINIIYPSDQSSTDFRRPIIKAEITDDKALDFPSIWLKIDDVNQTANATFANVPPKKTTLTYTPSQNMPIGQHTVKIHASDLNTTPNVTEITWSFNITDITTDDYDPSANIISPAVASELAPGSPIIVKYEAYDTGANNSGIDNLTINVRRGDCILYSKLVNISIYPDVVYSVPPQRSWEFPYNYVGGMNYTYNITIFDRSGRSGVSGTVGPFSVALPGQSSEFEVDTSSVNTANSKRLKNMLVKDNVSDSVFPYVTKVTVSWNPSSGELLENVRFENTNYWTGSVSNGSQVDISDYSVKSTSKPMDLYFDTNIRGKTFTITFLFSDSTTSTVTLVAPT